MRTLFGGILLAIGILIAGASGLCSLIFLNQLLRDTPSSSAVGMVLALGGIPFASGLGLIWAGRALIRRDRE